MNWSIRIENISKLYRMGRSYSTTASEAINNRLKKLFLPQSWLGKKVADRSIPETIGEQRTVIDASQLALEKPNHFWALDNINLEISEGERLGIIGENGCGKSTLLKILSRIVLPTKGIIRFRGRLISLLEIGTGFHAELTGRENIYLNGTIMGMKVQEIKQRIHDIIEFSELGLMIDTPVKRYSSGMYIRLAFSVAAFLESEILIVDEVLAVGDAAFQRKCLEKMLDLTNKGRTLLFVSHDMAIINKLCNRVIQMSHGKIINDSQIEPINAQKSTVNSITLDYLRSGNQYNAERIWLESELVFDTCIQLNHIRLLNKNNQPCCHFDIEECIYIEINFLVIHEKFPINVHCYLKELSGREIFVTMDNLAWPSREIRPQGQYIQRCILPSPFLNAGDYSIDLEIWPGEAMENRWICRSVVNFEVTEKIETKGVRGNWPNQWPNVLLRPQLEWQISMVSQQHKQSTQLTPEFALE